MEFHNSNKSAPLDFLHLAHLMSFLGPLTFNFHLNIFFHVQLNLS